MPPGIGPTPPTQYLSMAVFNGQFPQEGPKMIPISLNFGLQQSFNVDLTLAEATAQMRSIQSLYYDNSQNATPLQITCNGTGQVLNLPGHSGGTVAIFQTVPSIFKITCQGGGTAQVIFANIPLPTVIWPTTGEPSYSAAGYLQVTDVALDALIAGGSLNTTMNDTTNNNVVKPFFGSDEVFVGTATTGTTTLTTGSPSFFVTDFECWITGNAAISGGAAELQVQLKDGTTVIGEGFAEVPAASISGDMQPFLLFQLRDRQYNSKTNAANLTIVLSQTLTSGKVYWNGGGGLCSNIGP